MMTKKYFQKAANLLRDPLMDDTVRIVIADMFCAIFTEDNPRFDRARFLDAAGISDTAEAAAAVRARMVFGERGRVQGGLK